MNARRCWRLPAICSSCPASRPPPGITEWKRCTAATPAALLDAAGPRRIALAFLDLELEEPVWAEALACLTRRREAAADDSGEPLRIVAYGPHGEPETLRKARELGCSQTLIKRDFAEQIPTLLAAAASDSRP